MLKEKHRVIVSGFHIRPAPQRVFLCGAPLMLLQGETVQPPGREPRPGSAQQNTALIRRRGVSGTNPISYPSPTSCSMLQKASVQQLCETRISHKNSSLCFVVNSWCCSLYHPTAQRCFEKPGVILGILWEV